MVSVSIRHFHKKYSLRFHTRVIQENLPKCQRISWELRFFFYFLWHEKPLKRIEDKFLTDLWCHFWLHSRRQSEIIRQFTWWKWKNLVMVCQELFQIQCLGIINYHNPEESHTNVKLFLPNSLNNLKRYVIKLLKIPLRNSQNLEQLDSCWNFHRNSRINFGILISAQLSPIILKIGVCVIQYKKFKILFQFIFFIA